MKYITLTVLSLLTVFSRANDTTEFETFEVWKSESPNRGYFSAIRRMPEGDMFWKEDLDGFRMVVFPIKKHEADEALGELYYAFDVGGRVPARIQWTADSRFLVLTTVSSGGHSPWHFMTYVFSVAAKRVVCLDDVMGPVVDSDFKLEDPHSATFQIGKTDGFAGDSEHPTPRKLDISLLFSKNPKAKIKQADANQPAQASNDAAPGNAHPPTSNEPQLAGNKEQLASEMASHKSHVARLQSEIAAMKVELDEIRTQLKLLDAEKKQMFEDGMKLKNQWQSETAGILENPSRPIHEIFREMTQKMDQLLQENQELKRKLEEVGK